MQYSNFLLGLVVVSTALVAAAPVPSSESSVIMRRGEKDLQPVTSNPGSLTSALTTSDSSSGNSDGTSSDSESDSAAKQAAVLKGTSEEFQAWYKALPDAQKATVLTLKEGVLKKLQSKKLSAKARSAIIKSATNVAAVKANEEVENLTAGYNPNEDTSKGQLASQAGDPGQSAKQIAAETAAKNSNK